MATTMGDPDNPKTYGINLPTAMTIAAFCAIAWFNTVELQIRIWLGFKRYAGLYFWSLVLSSWGCTIHPMFFLFLDFAIIKQANACGVIIGISWWCMVTGQALVLYSRLYLVVRDKRKIRWVLIMIITNFCILHLPIMVLSQLAYSPVPHADRWLAVYNIYEKIQMTGFTIQETIISGLYLYETRKILRPGKIFQREKFRLVFLHLIWVNIFIIVLDLALLSTEYAGLFSIQTVFKAAVYSVKLRFEFVVLNELLDLVQGRTSAFDISGGAPSGGEYVNSHGVVSPRNNQVPLSQMGRRGTATTPKDEQSYSVFASKGRDPMDPKFGDGVLRTTEVHVVHGSPRSEDTYVNFETGQPQHVQQQQSQQQSKRMPPSPRHVPSPTSSEVEFAKNGEDPSYLP